jgi:DNA polymerase V
VGYDIENLTDSERNHEYKGPVKTDYYGRRVPVHAHGTANLGNHTASTKLITDAIMKLFDQIVNPKLLIRRVSLSANHVINETSIPATDTYEQLELFTDYEARDTSSKAENQALEREKKIQQAVIDIKKKYGKNAILKGMNLQEGATTVDRNNQIGGHKA